MQLLILLTIVAAAAADDLPDTFDSTQQERLLQVLSDLGVAPVAQESEFLKNHVMQDGVDLAARMAIFTSFLEKHPFTEHHAANLASHITFGTADRQRMARFAGAFAATAVRLYWESNPVQSTLAPTQALLFLERLFITGDEAVNNAIAEGINDTLKGNPVALEEHLTAAATSAERYVDAMQSCVSLGVFRGDRSAETWFTLPRRMTDFVDATGIWLLDNGALSEAHVTCLQNIFKAIPQPMHAVSALYVPQAVPFSAASSPLRLPGIALDIPVIPEEMQRDLFVMPPYVPQPPLPEFMMLALEQAMKAVVATNLPGRPDLMQRTAAVMRTAVSLPDSPVAELAPPEIMMATPDVFLIYLGTLWLANSEALLEAAILLAEQGNTSPLYTVLLVADLFSRQGDATLLFRASPMGTFSASETALRRMFITPTAGYVNGIAVGGRIWQYDMSGIVALP